MIECRDALVTVTTPALKAIFDRGWLVSLRCGVTGEVWVDAPAPDASALQIVHVPDDAVDVADRRSGRVEVIALSPSRAQVRFHGWDADGVLDVGVDEATGEVLVEPAASSARPGVLACRWRLPRVRPGLDLVAPFFQGVRLPPGDPLLQRRWTWPQWWEAGLAILQGGNGGWWVHCRDVRYRHKALHIADGALALDTEAYGPVDCNRASGGLAWRIGVHTGGWHEAAEKYRRWLWGAYGLGRQESRRKPWQSDIRLALCWYNGDIEVLEALAEAVDPRATLIHFSAWRTDRYDQNYPDYVASQEALKAFERASALGFHVMPHCNAVDMDPTNPAYALVRDFVYRDVVSGRALGWAWDPAAGGMDVPNSGRALQENRSRNVMVKVHPGLSLWRSLLAERVQRAVRQTGTDAVFLDVTLCSHNLRESLVEGTTSTEGMGRLIDEISQIDGGLAVGGEGLNEITMQAHSFAQVHLFTSWQRNCEGLARTGGCDLNARLFGRLCRTIGYSGLGGRTDDEELRMRLHEEHGAIPTITVGSAEDIRHPTRAVRRALEGAR
ncbi:MAG TPA: DUF6259 domain-containing protein [Chthonomonadales bacterium]|nr:DUF6259 domain-containing protein [Chthonomonadales bacterium]